MARISESVLDRWLSTPVRKLYPHLRIPRRFPPEGIVVFGHLSAIAAAVGFAFAWSSVVGGLIAALFVALSHISDCLDGTHARATDQCRNGGELLDHFLDPLSFSYWLIGIAVGLARLELGIAALVVLNATAILTSLEAKMLGEFRLARFGPTEFKALLSVSGLAAAVAVWFGRGTEGQAIAAWAFLALIIVGGVQLKLRLVHSVLRVNREGTAPDVTEWETKGES